MDIDKVQKLIEVMVENDLVEISIRDGDVEVNLRRPSASAPVPAASIAPPQLAAANTPVADVVVAAEANDADSDALVQIKSPMVGTFYLSSDPEAAPFVHSGTKVVPATVVCLLEAMKVFSEIKAEVSGTIERILVKNAEAVEYGQPLFLVRTV